MKKAKFVLSKKDNVGLNRFSILGYSKVGLEFNLFFKSAAAVLPSK